MNDIIEQIKEAVGGFTPNLLGALLVLVLGWLLALLAAALVRGALKKTTVDNRVAQWVAGDKQAQVPVEIYVSRAVFLLIMLFVLLAFFQNLQLPVLSENLNQLTQRITGYVPHLLGAAALILLAWLVATVLKRGTQAALQAAKFDERLGAAAGADATQRPISPMLAEAVYWLVFVMFLPAILGALELQSILEPVNAMFNKVLGFLPQLFGAAVILVVGWFGARVVQRLATSLLATAGADASAEQWGLSRALGKLKLSGLVGVVLYYLILIPVIVAALGALQLEAITTPASSMLTRVSDALPAIFSAGILLFLSFIAGRLVAGLLRSVLSGLGFNSLPVKLGLARTVVEGDRSPSALAGKLALAVILLFASMEAANLLGFENLAAIVSDFISFGGHVLMGLIIFALGLLLANFVAGVVRASDSSHAPLLALGARLVILLLAGAMALRQMELANDIVNLAFGFVVGAIAVALALAFGLGGRDSAAALLADWRRKVANPDSKPPQE